MSDQCGAFPDPAHVLPEQWPFIRACERPPGHEPPHRAVMPVMQRVPSDPPGVEWIERRDLPGFVVEWRDLPGVEDAARLGVWARAERVLEVSPCVRSRAAVCRRVARAVVRFGREALGRKP